MPHSLRDLSGIGIKTEQLFEKVGVRSQEDLLAYYPRGYESYRSPVRLDEAVAGEVNAVEAVILKTPSVRSFSGRSITIALISDGESAIQADWFNMPYLRTKLRPGMRFIFRGVLTEKGGRRILTQPKLFTLAEYEQIQGRMLPLYSLTAGLSNQTISKAVRGVLSGGILPRETLPESIREKRSLIGLSEATGAIHFPASREELARAHRRLVYDEFFYFLLGVERLRTKNGREPNGFPMPKQSLQRRVRSSLPYELTGGQKEILEAVLGDLSSDHRMHRLIQGDVGSGKTILAFLAMLTAYENGFQCALMVPTEVLALQHAKALLELLPSAGIDPHAAALLTGSLTKKRKKART
jgi:ATP-dependent DNA helicase RecG